MATIQLNILNCTSTTWQTSGVKVPSAGVVTGITSAEAQSITGDPGEWDHLRVAISNVAGGTPLIFIPLLTGTNTPVLTSITVNGNTYNSSLVGGQNVFSITTPADLATFLLHIPAFLITG